MANKWNMTVRKTVDLTIDFSVEKEGDRIVLLGHDGNGGDGSWREVLNPGDAGYDFFDQLFEEGMMNYE